MRLEAPPRRKLHIALTPLIDVVFLLLVFFMLASTFMKFQAVPISAAKGGGGSARLDEIALIDLEPGGAVLLNGRTLEGGNLRAGLEALIGKGIRRAVIRPRNGSTVQDVVRALESARSTAIEEVVVVK